MAAEAILHADAGERYLRRENGPGERYVMIVSWGGRYVLFLDTNRRLPYRRAGNEKGKVYGGLGTGCIFWGFGFGFGWKVTCGISVRPVHGFGGEWATTGRRLGVARL